MVLVQFLVVLLFLFIGMRSVVSAWVLPAVLA